MLLIPFILRIASALGVFFTENSCSEKLFNHLDCIFLLIFGVNQCLPVSGDPQYLWSEHANPSESNLVLRSNEISALVFILWSFKVQCKM